MSITEAPPLYTSWEVSCCQTCTLLTFFLGRMVTMFRYMESASSQFTCVVILFGCIHPPHQTRWRHIRYGYPSANTWPPWFALLCNIPFHQTMGKANSRLYMYYLGSPDTYSNDKGYITQCSSRTHFTTDLWANNWYLVKMISALILSSSVMTCAKLWPDMIIIFHVWSLLYFTKFELWTHKHSVQ